MRRFRLEYRFGYSVALVSIQVYVLDIEDDGDEAIKPLIMEYPNAEIYYKKCDVSNRYHLKGKNVKPTPWLYDTMHA